VFNCGKIARETSRPVCGDYDIRAVMMLVICQIRGKSGLNAIGLGCPFNPNTSYIAKRFGLAHTTLIGYHGTALYGNRPLSPPIWVLNGKTFLIASYPLFLTVAVAAVILCDSDA